MSMRTNILASSAFVATLAFATPAFAQDCSGAAVGTTNATACGALATATADGATAVGVAANARGIDSVALGSDDGSTQYTMADDYGTAVGGQALANAYSTAVGWDARASAQGGAAFGANAHATADGATSVGGGSSADGVAASAFGNNSHAVGFVSIAVGNGSYAGDYAIALGTNSQAGFNSSVAIGTGTFTTRANQIKLGNTGSSVTIGDIASSTTAQVGPVNLMTVDATGTVGAGPAVASLATESEIVGINTQLGTMNTQIGSLDTQVGTLNTQVGALNTQVGALGTRIDGLGTRMDALSGEVEQNRRVSNEGIAMALAMDSPAIPDGSTFAMSGGIGYFDRQAAGSAAIGIRLGHAASFSAGLGVGFNTGKVGARGGFAVGF